MSDERPDPPLPVDERRLRIEEKKAALESSFARKWLPAMATVTVGLIAGMFGYVQQHASLEQTVRTRIEANAKDEREWGFKVIEMYFSKHEMFDLTKNPDQAASNLRVLAAVAPAAVQGVLSAERARIPAPTDINDPNRIASLEAAQGVQEALAVSSQGGGSPPAVEARPANFTVYVQYGEGDRDLASRAQNALVSLGYRVPGIQQVARVPSRLQVRYYRADQKTLAGALAGELGAKLGLKASADSAIQVTSEKRLPGGILELWLPHQTAGEPETG
jgi:hypothetical protein